METDEILPTQVKAKLVPIDEVLNSCFFAWGVEDVRCSRPPAFDDRTVPPKDWPLARVAVLGNYPVTVNDVLDYERGRMLGALMPASMQLRTKRGTLSVKAVALFRNAVAEGSIRWAHGLAHPNRRRNHST